VKAGVAVGVAGGATVAFGPVAVGSGAGTTAGAASVDEDGFGADEAAAAVAATVIVAATSATEAAGAPAETVATVVAGGEGSSVATTEAAGDVMEAARAREMAPPVKDTAMIAGIKTARMTLILRGII